MKLILAQGNPGSKYAATRHNVAFAVLEACAKKLGSSFVLKSKFQAEIAETIIDGEKVLLVKPTTFYNLTGQVARSLIDFYKLSPATDLMVIHDDLMLPFGTLRVREKGSDAGNNGIKSINSHVGENYTRLRIGISTSMRQTMGDTNFVLGRFSAEEDKTLSNLIIPKSLEVVNDFAADNLAAVSYQLISEPKDSLDKISD